MGRQAKPTALKLVTGNPGKRALNRQEPDPDYLKDLAPPDWMTKSGRQVWLREAPRQSESRLLTVIDATAFARWCEDQAAYEGCLSQAESLSVLIENEKDPEKMTKLMNRLLILRNWIAMYCNRLATADREFGRTPAARTKINVVPQGDLFGSSPEESYLTG